MNDVYYFTPLHNKFIIFDDVTKLVVIILLIIIFYFVKNIKVKSRR